MSYARMDHAEWVNLNNAAGRRITKKPRSDCRKGYHAAPEKLNPFQAKVMDILGMVGGGIYNCPIVWDKVEWQPTMVYVPWRASGGLGTFDFEPLTRLVFLCHEARIRGYITPHGFNHFGLQFNQRSHEGGMYARHPNLSEAVTAFRQYLPPNHRIIYQAPASAEEAA